MKLVQKQVRQIIVIINLCNKERIRSIKNFSMHIIELRYERDLKPIFVDYHLQARSIN